MDRLRRACDSGVCDHVETIDQTKAAELDAGEQGEHFGLYMHMTGSDGSGTDTAEEGSSTDTASESEAVH